MHGLQEELTETIKVKPLIFEGAYDPNLAQFQDFAIATQSEATADLLVALSHPELIRRMHQDYVAAGCDVLQTFTWGVHRTCFDCYYPPVDDDQIRQAAKRAAEIACEVAKTALPRKERRWVTGIVPAGVSPIALQQTTLAAAQSAAQLVAEGLIAGGAEMLVLALQPSIVEAKAALHGVLQACETMKSKPPLFVSFDLGPAGNLMFGDDLGEALTVCESTGVFSAGVYLTTHPERLPEAHFKSNVRRAPAHVFADAGYYTAGVDGKARCSLEPKEYGQIVAGQARRLDLAFIGGGWGLSPTHIHELRLAIDADR
jgi:5-methyltetrahydrofolate--homocysteine methyltransferase